MKQKGRVISSDADHALVQIVRQSACGGNCKSCGGSCSAMGVLISTPNPIHAKSGEIVDVDSDSGKVLKIAATFYLVPLLLVVLGMVASKLYLFPERASALSDLLALAIGAGLYGFSLFLIHLYGKKKKMEYTISRR